jgi:hypothetical protein
MNRQGGGQVHNGDDFNNLQRVKLYCPGADKKYFKKIKIKVKNIEKIKERYYNIY